VTDEAVSAKMGYDRVHRPRGSSPWSLVVNALGALSQHLIVLLDPAAIVDTMHDAYGRLNLAASPYGVFLAGPSATGDIEGVIIHGAQGARSLTVLLINDRVS
jgi:L-lactate dehydrogenase complex protein LldG